MRTGEELGQDGSRSQVLQISSQISSPSDSDGLENNLESKDHSFQESRRIIYKAHGHLTIRPPFASFTFCAREGSSRQRPSGSCSLFTAATTASSMSALAQAVMGGRDARAQRCSRGGEGALQRVANEGAGAKEGEARGRDQLMR